MEQNRNSILQSARELIAEGGFKDAQVQAIADKSGVSSGLVYRYFENKHKLLVYLSSWYWSWIEYRLVFGTMNINESEKKLLKAITIVTEKIEDDLTTAHINESILSKIIIAEFSKTLHTKEVDEENKEGFFLIYKRVIQRLASFILEVQAEYPFAKCLASTIVEGALHQHYLRLHFKTITECNDSITPTDFYCHLTSQLFQIKI